MTDTNGCYIIELEVEQQLTNTKKGITNMKINDYGHVQIKGNFLEWYNELYGWLEGKADCPVDYVNVKLLTIDEECIWLELPRDYLVDDTWEITFQGVTVNNENLKGGLS